MSAKTVAVQGSGWGWLGYNKTEKRLEVVAMANQDPLIGGASPRASLSAPSVQLGRVLTCFLVARPRAAPGH